MAMNCLKRLLDVTRSLGIYDFERDPSVPAELYAYAAGLDGIAQLIDRSLAELFPETADEEGLRRFERLLRLMPEGDLEQRRQSVYECLGRRRGAWSRVEYFDELAGSGFTGTWTEEPENFTLRLNFGDDFTAEQMRDVFSAAYRLLPAHLRPAAAMDPLTWDQIDGSGLAFSHWDESCICWDAADA